MAKTIVEYRQGSRKGKTVPGKVATKAPKSDAYVVHWLVDAKKNDAAGFKAASKIVSQRQRDAEGKLSLYRFVDARSASFGADFDKVFRSNVRKARRENKRIVGTTDRGVAKD